MKLKKQTEGFHLSSDNDYNIVPYPFSGLYEHLMFIENYSCMYIDNDNVYILESDLSTHFEPLENFKEFQIMGKKNKALVLGQRNYSLKDHDNFFITVDKEIVDDGWTIEQTKEVEEINEALEESKSRKISRIYYKEESEDIEDIVQLLNKILVYESPLRKKAKVSVVISTPQGYQLKTAQIKPKPIDLDKHYNDDFKKIHKALMNCFTDSKKGIALLHGRPGTGKTNYIKNLTKMAPEKNFIYIPSNMIGFITDPSFIGQMIDYKDSVLIIEDCEKYIQDRKNDTGNNNFVSTLLNLSDGILSDMMDLQIICTFNNDLGDIDSALLRKGRLIAEYEFKALTKDKADRLLKELNYILEEGKESTLANIYNANVMEFVEGNKKQNKIGFR